MTIRPISDLRNYPSVMEEVENGKPVVLTKNGKSAYVIMNYDEFERYTDESASLELLSILERSNRTGKEEGYIPLKEAFESLKGRYGKK